MLGWIRAYRVRILKGGAPGGNDSVIDEGAIKRVIKDDNINSNVRETYAEVLEDSQHYRIRTDSVYIMAIISMVLQALATAGLSIVTIWHGIRFDDCQNTTCGSGTGLSETLNLYYIIVFPISAFISLAFLGYDIWLVILYARLRLGARGKGEGEGGTVEDSTVGLSDAGARRGKASLRAIPATLAQSMLGKAMAFRNGETAADKEALTGTKPSMAIYQPPSAAMSSTSVPTEVVPSTQQPGNVELVHRTAGGSMSGYQYGQADSASGLAAAPYLPQGQAGFWE